VKLELILVQPGTFSMGGESFGPVHQVTLTMPFYLGKYEFTRLQGAAASSYQNLNEYPESTRDYPFYGGLDQINPKIETLNELTDTNIPDNWAFMLPTEAQWEYACKAGTTTWFSWGKNTYEAGYANWDNINGSAPSPQRVGSYLPNPWGFYDMHGNIAEYVYGWLASYTDEPKIDPKGAESPDWRYKRILRGGSFISHTSSLLWSHYRFQGGGYESYTGFRVSLQEKWE